MTAASFPPDTLGRDRRGMVVLQFDDGRACHWTNAFPILEAYGLKGTFGIVTGQLGLPGHLSRSQVVAMAAAGHEIHDHTYSHDPAFWGDTANAALWPGRIELSLGIFAQMGLTTRGWNQPGGVGQGFSPQLRDTLKLYYEYAAGRVGVTTQQKYNFHWNFLDDPFSLGRSVNSWNNNEGNSPAEELANMITILADGYARGLVVVPAFHNVLAEDSTEWALTHVCSTVVANNLECLTLEEALHRVEHSHDFIAAWDNEMPNPDFLYDIDHNGRPDGWDHTYYAPPGTNAQAAKRVAEIANGGGTIVYGPERGQLRLSFDASAPSTDAITVRARITEIDEDYGYTTYPVAIMRSTLTNKWRKYSYDVTIPPRTDRIQLVFDGILNCVYIAHPSLALASPSGVSSERVEPPARLLPNFPNPFNPSTTIPFILREPADVLIEIYDVRGTRVRVLLDGWRDAGEYRVEWDGRGDGGRRVASGVYYCRLWAKGVQSTRPLVLVD